MPRIAVEVESTVGSAIGGRAEPVGGKGAGAAGWGGWPVGEGHVLDALDAESGSLRALILMCEPALPSVEVAAWPIGVLHLVDGDRDLDELLCVADERCFARVHDLEDLAARHGEPTEWVNSLARLSCGHHYRIVGCGRRDEADRLLAEGHHAYLQLTGCLE